MTTEVMSGAPQVAEALGGAAPEVTRDSVRSVLDAKVPDVSRADRTRSRDVEAFPVPTGREEEWRFTPLSRVRPLFEPVADGRPDAVRVDVRSEDSSVVVREHSAEESLVRPGDRAAAVAAAGAAVRTTVEVPAETALTAPVLVDLVGAGGRGAVDLVVDVGAFSRATVVLDHTGDATFGGTVGIRVGDSADVTVVSLQSWDDTAVHVGQHDAVLGRDATFRHIAVSLGGSAVRLDVNVDFTGPGASSQCLGLYFADAGQHLEHRLFVDHSQPTCTSDVQYKGALQGDGAHTVWVGDVLIRAEATGIDTYELNRNLVLTDGARADSVPNLEIETGQIEGAGHASATGRFDDEQLFYLMARGMRPLQARRLVVRGFFAEILQKIGIEAVETRLLDVVERRLSDEALAVTPDTFPTTPA
ncbi:Fe-S cluster assembly protein SufD [Aquipuribacter nitratireducens]|uniref:Fe-S cluster assembly protein SufD n=1 Tax=Aquipuribacter nitratireducens TaxID=650104 RepID=A0ABW0GIB6_9MICO